MNVVLLTRSLSHGGTERQAVALANGLLRRGHRVDLVTLFDGDRHFERELGASAPLTQSLRLRGRRSIWRFAAGGLRLVRSLRPEVVYGFNVETNLLALAAGRSVGAGVAWGIRTGDLERFGVDSASRAAIRLHRALSWAPDVVVSSSRAGAEACVAAGFPRETMRIVPAGTDTQRFRPDPRGRARVRQELGIRDGQLAVGYVARLHPSKDHELFLGAAAILSRSRPELRFVCAGDGEPPFRAALERRAVELGLGGGRVLWTGARRDMPDVYNGLDAAAHPSSLEGLANAVAEAMACGLVCAVADVGDLAAVVGETGVVVGERSAEALAAGLEEALARARSPAASRAARSRIETLYGLERMIVDSEAALLAARARAARRDGRRSG